MMDTKNIIESFARIGLPILGAALPVPGGAAIGSALAAFLGSPDKSPQGLLDAVMTSDDALVKARQFQMTHEETLLRITVDAEVATMVAVNKTMQGEAASEHWPTYSWRPFIGFMFGAYIGSMWVLPLFGVQPVALNADLTLTVGAILGVASFFRGKMQADPAIPTINKG